MTSEIEPVPSEYSIALEALDLRQTSQDSIALRQGDDLLPILVLEVPRIEHLVDPAERPEAGDVPGGFRGRRPSLDRGADEHA